MCGGNIRYIKWLVEWTLAVASVSALNAAIAVDADLVILLVDAVPVTATPVGVLSGCFSGTLVNCEVTLPGVDATELDHLRMYYKCVLQ